MSSAVTRRDFVTAALVAGAGLARAADALSGPHAVDDHTPATAGLEWRNRHPEMRYHRLGRTGFMISEIVSGGDPIAPDNNRHVEAAIDFGLSAIRHACLVCGWDPALAASAAGAVQPIT